MTNDNGLNLLQPFIKEAEKSNDPYLLVHFSREDDHFKGYMDVLDKFYAQIIINYLIEHFKMNAVDAIALKFKRA